MLPTSPRLAPCRADPRRSFLPGLGLLCLLVLALVQPALGPPALADNAAHRGGTLRLLASTAAGTLDPQINYTGQFWQLYAAVYDGLVAFAKVSGPRGNQVVADLADAVPQPQDGGRLYRFHLRPGIRFSDGRSVTVADVAASFRRIFRVGSPTAGSFYANIIGADRCLAAPATCTLAGGMEVDPATATVTFHLLRPDPEFLFKLAVPHAAILPADAPDHDAGSTPIPGTGAYRFISYNPERSLRLARNPWFQAWNAEAQPDGYVDAIEIGFGLEDEAQVTEIENGQADGMEDDPPADRLVELGRRYQAQIRTAPLMAMLYLPLNVNLPPFSSLAARQALAYAVDRAALVKLAGGPALASPVCQALPPGFPGHVDDCPYTIDPGPRWSAPDMARARQLMRQSGMIGQRVTLIVSSTGAARAMGVYLQSLLDDLGYRAELRPISGNIEFTYIQNTANHVQISLSSWGADYPAASDFLNVLFGCASFHPGSDSSINIAGFCDQALDARMQQALGVTINDADAANALWAGIDHAMTRAAPAVFLLTPQHLDFISARVGHYVWSDQFRWLLAESWVQ